MLPDDPVRTPSRSLGPITVKNGLASVALMGRRGWVAVGGIAQSSWRVSVSSAGVQGNGISVPLAVSSGGQFVAFGSLATNLVPGDTNGGKATCSCAAWRPEVAPPEPTAARDAPVERFYPSGHAAFAYTAAEALVDILPEWQDAIRARAATYTRYRVVCGVHSPSDIEGSMKKLGDQAALG